MTRSELSEILSAKGIRPDLYSLYGLHAESETYSIVQEENGYSVFYKERGHAERIAEGLSESGACQYVLEQFQTMFNWGS